MMYMMYGLIQRIVKANCDLSLITCRGVHSTSVMFAGARYRASQGRERHVNMTREFSDTPDWSYLDGRPAPLGYGQRKRYNRQVEYNQAIQSMIHQIDTAKAAEVERVERIAKTKQQIVASKLRSKGRHLIEQTNPPWKKERTNFRQKS